MNQKIIFYAKYVKFLYACYYYVGTFSLRLLRLFVKQQDHLILFIAYGGRKYDDSPKCIYEAMCRDGRFDDYELVWAFNSPDTYTIGRGRKIKTDTLQYFATALKARCWVTNSSVERGLSFKGKRTFYLNTWHGGAIKLMGSDIPQKNTSFRTKSKTKLDVMLSQSDYEARMFSRVFNIPLERFAIIGRPRNDELVAAKPDDIKRLKASLNIESSKKVILYAPTFREYENKGAGCHLSIPVDFHKWEKCLSDEYVLLFRAHYEVASYMNVQDSDFLRNVSDYPQLNDLMIVADILISDYSSIFYDFSVMGKPMLCFAYDYEEYSQKRGLYFDIRKELSCENICNEDQLLDAITHLDKKKACLLSCQFRDKYVTAYGEATQKSLDIIASELNKNKQ